MAQKWRTLYVLLLGLLLSACSQNNDAAAWRTYPDAVVSLNQVDPAYRAYFRAQHGSNYSLRDQREAFMAATRTARTPVPKYAPQPKAAPAPKKGATRSKAKTKARKGKAATKASRKTSKAKKKPARKTTRRRR